VRFPPVVTPGIDDAVDVRAEIERGEIGAAIAPDDVPHGIDMRIEPRRDHQPAHMLGRRLVGGGEVEPGEATGFVGEGVERVDMLHHATPESGLRCHEAKINALRGVRIQLKQRKPLIFRAAFSDRGGAVIRPRGLRG